MARKERPRAAAAFQDQIRAYHARGRSDADIAAALGLAGHQVREERHIMGLPTLAASVTRAGKGNKRTHNPTPAPRTSLPVKTATEAQVCDMLARRIDVQAIAATTKWTYREIIELKERNRKEGAG